MKRITMGLALIALLAGVLATADADAGWLGKSKNKKLSDKRTEKPEWMKKPARYDKLPSADFHMGVLWRDSYTGWQVGDVSLLLAKDCVIEREGVEVGVLDEGRQAIVMGPRNGNTIVAWRVRILEMDYENTRTSNETVLERSQVDPTVGRIVSAPY